MADLFPELNNLKGGPKQKWLRLHRQLVLDYYYEHDSEATRKEFHLKPWTLDRLLSPPKATQARFSKLDRVLSRLEIVEEGERQVFHKVDKMEKQYRTFVDTLGDRVFFRLVSLLKAAFSRIELPAELEMPEETDPLGFSDFLKSLENEAKKTGLYVMSGYE